MSIWFIFRLITHIALLFLILTAILTLIFLILFLARITRTPTHRIPLAAPAPPDTLGLQLQAYERLVVFAERISPGQLIRRLAVPEVSARELQFALVQAITSEFDHNLSQQIYVSAAAWEGIRNAKEQEIHLINGLGDSLGDQANGSTLAKKLLELESSDSPAFPVQIALTILNTEARKLMGSQS